MRAIESITRLRTGSGYRVVCKPCVVCSERATFNVNADDFAVIEAWRGRRGGEKIQRLLPHWTDERRELLISGTHDKCWKSLFASLAEDE